MQASSNTPPTKILDPIWKRLFVDRIYTIFMIISGIAAIVFMLIGASNGISTTNALFFPLLFWLIVLLGNIYVIITRTRFWRGIGQRRLEILRGERDTQSLRVNYQLPPEEHALAIPTRLQMGWKRSILFAIAALTVTIVLLLLIIGVILALQHDPAFNDFLLLTLIMLMTVLITVAIMYFTKFRYQSQMIELTEAGIKTRYLRQKRFLPWHEARIFASYGAQGTMKSLIVTTYELSNEHTVVRWSQQVPTNFFLQAETSDQKLADWNQLVGRVNASVAAHTGLPLLDLNDGHQPRTAGPIYKAARQSPKIEPLSYAAIDPSPATVKIAQNDPVMSRLNLRKSGTALAVTGVVGTLAFLFALYEKFWTTATTRPGLLDAAFLNFLLYGGLLLAFFTFLLLWLLWVAGRNLGRVQIKRQQAILYPERFQTSPQPIPSSEPPQPTSIQIEVRKKAFFLLSFVESFVIWFIFSLLFISPPDNIAHILGALVGSLLFSLAMSLFIVAMTRQSSRTRIEINKEGISTRTGTLESHMHWHDARLFAKYRPQGLLKKNTRVWLYELNSEQTIVRWQWPRSQKWRAVLEPTMTQEAYERWLDQLQRYVMARTDLPLLNLDTEDGATANQ